MQGDGLRLLLRRRAVQVTTDWVGLIDEWAARFFDELDYRTEAQNALKFARQMEGLDGITVSVPRVQLTNRTVLTTDWVQGAPVLTAVPREACLSVAWPVSVLVLLCMVAELCPAGQRPAQPLSKALCR